MVEFSIQDAAFTGFRVVREHPRSLGVWTVYALGLYLLLATVVVGLMGPDMMKISALGRDTAADPAVVVALAGRLLPGYLVVLGLLLVSNAVLGAAMIRSVLRPADERLGYLRLSADELRQLGLGLLTFAVFFGANLAVAMVGGLLGAAVNASAGAVNLLMLVGLVCGTIYLAVRLSLAPALTFDSGRIDLLGSWTLTRGRFWPLFGTYSLTLALIVVIYLLSELIILAFGAVLNGGDFTAAAASPDMSSLAVYFTPWRLAQTILTAGVAALVWPVLFTPPTAIYGLLAASRSPATAVHP